MRLAIQNLKKHKKQYVSFGIMLFIAAFIINIALVLNSQSSDAYDKQFEKLNTADINILIPLAQDDDNLLNEIDNLKGVTLTERHEGLYSKATIHNFAGTNFEMNTVFYRITDKRDINLLNVSNTVKNSKGTIYIPEYVSKLGGFSVGDTITYSIGKQDYSFSVGGTVSEMEYGNYGTNLIGAYLPKKAYKTLASRHRSNLVAEYSVKLKNNANLDTVKKRISSLISDKKITLLTINNRKTTKQARSMISNLLIAIFVAIAFIIFLISLFLSSFRIRNHIENELINMGVLKATGYTSSNIIMSEIIPYILTAAFASIAGTLISYTVLPSIADFLATQSGFSFRPIFDWSAILLSTGTTITVTGICTYFCARKIRRLEPINAIRGIDYKRTTKNHFPLATSKFSVKFSLILKQIFASLGQNILLFILTFGIMTLLAFSGTLLYNVNFKSDNFLKTISDEMPSAIFTVSTQDDLRQLKSTLQNDDKVKEVLGYTSVSLNYANGAITSFVSEDFSRVNNNIVYQGKNPVKSDEIAVGSALSKQYKIGSKVKITNDDRSYNYTVTGYIQSINNQGIVCELTDAGYQKISKMTPKSLNVYLKKGATAKNLIKKYKKKFPNMTSTNYEQLLANSSKMYAGIVSSVTVIIFIIAALVILLVMYIIINALIITRKREFGIYKALGWSNRQLILQLAFSFTPIISIAAIFSAIIDLSLVPIMNNAVWGMLGANKNHFEVSLAVLLAFAFILICISFIVSVVLARPIRKINPYSLLKE
ncbi:ABC transporter permease [Streptococcus downei]|uniref:ABC transporter permease protein n=1 Tax=Streptococcus downei MFe28 TaxID=764290 RepID=A0A380JBF9_STRDO|nr:ABC transporter permease [Streptococcus downei]EFQ56888.1 efflux ABC transporter, permease protein [Streptococcus downei F0415]SUN35312.1 ABC transporter permease protein [Streptococcus downei MFe28]